MSTLRQLTQRQPEAIRAHGASTERSLLKMLDSEVCDSIKKFLVCFRSQVGHVTALPCQVLATVNLAILYVRLNPDQVDESLAADLRDTILTLLSATAAREPSRWLQFLGDVLSGATDSHTEVQPH